MGIRGLQKYIKDHCEGGYEAVNIPDIAKKYKQETGLDPVIAWDISSCIREIYKKNQINWLEGDRYKKFESAINGFLESFTSIGIKFFVIFDGVTPDMKLPVWISRKKWLANTLTDIFRSLKNNNMDEALNVETDFILPPMAFSVLESIFLSNENCTCKYSVLEADEELANYATNNNCFAYLTGDSDFIIYDGAKYCLSIRDLDLETMTTRNYNRKALAKSLNMDVAQLPIFALLCGSDAIPFDIVKPFHHELLRLRPSFPTGNEWYKILFQDIANFVDKLPRGRNILCRLPQISQTIFKTEEYSSRLEDGLKNYWGDINYPAIPKINNENWDEILEKCYKNHVELSFDSLIYNILFGYSVKIGPFLENMKDTNLPPSSVASWPLRKKLYGILLYEKPNREEIYVEEWLGFSEDSLNESFKVNPAFIEHPGLLTLWNEKDQSRETVKARWQTFCKAISPKLKYREIMALPKDLVLPILALFFLNNEFSGLFESQLGTFKVKNFEIEMLLAQAVFVNKITIEKIDKLIESFKRSKVCWNINTRAVHLGSVFQSICGLLFSLSVACGNLVSRSEASAAEYFDGKLFMCLYNMQSALTDSQIWKNMFHQEIRESYEQYLNLIMNPN